MKPLFTFLFSYLILFSLIFNLAGCGYRIIKTSDLDTIRKMNRLTGYMECLNTKGGLNVP